MGGRHAKERRRRIAKSDFFALGVADGSDNARVSDSRVVLVFGVGGVPNPYAKENDDHGEQRKTVLDAAHHFSEGVGERDRDREQQIDRQEVREAGRVFEGCRRVGVEESSAVGAKLLDGFHETDRSSRKCLAHVVQDVVEARRAGERLDRPFSHEDDAKDKGDREQYVEQATGHVDPEVADGRRRSSASWCW